MTVTTQPTQPTSPTAPGRSGVPRGLAVAALAAAPLLAGLSEVLQPDLGGTAAERLAAIDGTLPAVSAVAFLVGQLPMLVAVVVIGGLVRHRHPRLAAWGTGLGVVGAFGHTVFGGMSMVWLAMAHQGAADRAAYARVLDALMNSPVMLFSVCGLVGTVIGLLLLSIALFRGGVGPRWVGPALWAFLVVEFVGTSLSASAAYLSALLFAAAFLGLAAYVVRRPR